MKKIIALIIVLVCFTATAEADLYYRFGNIVDIEYDTDFVTVDDGMGNLWDFMSTPIAEYYFYGDLLLMIMDDNDTPEWIYDDKVIEANYCDTEDAEALIKRYRDERSKIIF